MEFLSQNIQLIVAAGVVLLALLVVLGVWRAFGPRMAGRRGQRLGISEYLELDKTRRLVLVRRDNVEHLILIGGGQDVVVEPSITASGMASSHYAPSPSYVEPVAPPPPVSPPPIQPAAGTARPAPRPPMFSERKTPLRPAGEPAPLRTRDDPEL